MHPDRIGPYLIDRKIGSGGMGNVYLGTHETTGEQVAVKVLPASMAREEGFVSRFSREIEALRKVSHQNIVQIYEDGQTDDGSYYFSMEYVDGETLTSIVTQQKQIPWPEVIDLSLQIASALKAAHNEGIVHRDLKPSNLMVTDDGTVKLADFGVAHVFATTRLTRTGGVVGTAEYMSPEQSRGQRATKLSDMYSLGAVMYVMLTGRPPFTGQTAGDILHKHQYAQCDKPGRYVPEIPRLLEDFVCKLLEKRPENRIPDAFVAIRQLTNIRSRIEFEQQQKSQTATAAASSRPDLTSPVAADRTQGSQDDASRYLPGPATMVRDAIRDDIQASLKKSPLAQFFDNTFVLITLLCLVIAAGFYFSTTTTPDPGENFSRAKEIMENEPSAAWLRIRDDVLQPLLASGELEDKREQMQQWVQMADQYEFCRKLQIATPSDGSSQSELHRLIAFAFETYTDGRVSDATEQLHAIQNLLTDDDVYLRDFLQSTLQEWEADHSNTGRRELVRRIIDQAQSAIDGDGDPQQAADALQSVVVLFNDDRFLQKELDTCRSLLETLSVQAQE